MAKPDSRNTYPIRCVECGKKQVQPAVVRHELQKNHDGRTYDLLIEQLPVNRCEACGEIYFTNASDDAIAAALRAKLGLLAPEQIRNNIAALGMQQKQLAECIGVAPETLSRWVSGSMIQSRAMDSLLRAYFGCAEVRAALTGRGMDRGFGASVSPSTATTGRDAELVLRRASHSTQLRQRIRELSRQPESHDLASIVTAILARPRVARSFTVWSRALVGTLCGRDPLSGQGDLFGWQCDDRNTQRREMLFESFAAEFAQIPGSLRDRALESLRATVSVQREAILRVQPELAPAARPLDDPD